MKKQFLIVAGIATFAVGAAFAGKSSSTKSLLVEAKRVDRPEDPCNTIVPCHPSPVANCVIYGAEYQGFNQQTGMCNQPLELD